MTDRELFGCFAIKYDEKWFPVLEFENSKPPSEREMFEYFCRANCVTEPRAIETEWQKHLKAKAAAAAATREKLRGGPAAASKRVGTPRANPRV